VKILLQPGEILASFFPSAAVTTRRFATGHANELATLDWRNLYFRCRTVGGPSQDKRYRTMPANNASGHAFNASGNCEGKPSQKVGGDGRIDPSKVKVLSLIKNTYQVSLAQSPETNRHAKSR